MVPHPGLVEQLDLFNLTAPLSGAHPGGGDCTHYCSNMGGPVHYLAIKFLQTLHRVIMAEEGGGRRVVWDVRRKTTVRVKEATEAGEKLVEGVAMVAGVAAGAMLVVGTGLVLMGNARKHIRRGLRMVEEGREGLERAWRGM